MTVRAVVSSLCMSLVTASVHAQTLGGRADSDCCIPHDTPGCDDGACEAAVCAQDPFCCSPVGNWDSFCVTEAVELCGGLCEPPPGPVNDGCEDSIEIFDGETEFDTTNASTDGQAHSPDLCQFDGQTYHDIWYDYFATCTGAVTVTTCEELGGSASYDTDIAVYDGCDICIPGDDLVLGCNDDDPVNPCGTAPDFHSTVVVSTVSGNCYKIRIGGFKGGDSGTGTALIACELDPCECANGRVTLCHMPPGNLANARTITVGCAARDKHLAHGDTCGPCEDGDG